MSGQRFIGFAGDRRRFLFGRAAERAAEFGGGRHRSIRTPECAGGRPARPSGLGFRGPVSRSVRRPEPPVAWTPLVAREGSCAPDEQGRMRQSWTWGPSVVRMTTWPAFQVKASLGNRRRITAPIPEEQGLAHRVMTGESHSGSAVPGSLDLSASPVGLSDSPMRESNSLEAVDLRA